MQRKWLLYTLLTAAMFSISLPIKAKETTSLLSSPDTISVVDQSNSQKAPPSEQNTPSPNKKMSPSDQNSSDTEVIEGTAPSDESNMNDSQQLRPDADPPVFDVSYNSQFTKMLIAILIIIFVACILVWLLRRAGPGRSFQTNRGKNIKIIERRAISSQTYLYHIEVGGKQFIVAESKADVRTLATLDWPETPE